MTPARLCELKCPQCSRTHWEIDADYRGMPMDTHVPYEGRTYPCPHCGMLGSGYRVVRQSAPGFFLQPSYSLPMTVAEFEQWMDIVRTHFPSHPCLQDYPHKFYPVTPEQALEREPPVIEVSRTGGARYYHPTTQIVLNWLNVIEQRGDALTLTHKAGGDLVVRGIRPGLFSARCTDASGATVADAEGLSKERTRTILTRYLDGDVEDCMKE